MVSNIDKFDNGAAISQRGAGKERYYLIRITVAIILVHVAFFRGINRQDTTIDPMQQLTRSSNQSVLFFDYADDVADFSVDEVSKFLKNATISAEAAKLFFRDETVQNSSSLSSSNFTHLRSQILPQAGAKVPTFPLYEEFMSHVKQFPTKSFTYEIYSPTYAPLLTRIRLLRIILFEYFSAAEGIGKFLQGKPVGLILGKTKAGKSSLKSHIRVNSSTVLNTSVETSIQPITNSIHSIQLDGRLLRFLNFAGFL